MNNFDEFKTTNKKSEKINNNKEIKMGRLEDGVVVARPTSAEGMATLELQARGALEIKVTKFRFTKKE
jgi:hypothetical protein